MTSAVEC